MSKTKNLMKGWYKRVVNNSFFILSIVFFVACTTSKKKVCHPTVDSVWYFLTTESFPDSEITSTSFAEVLVIEQTLPLETKVPQKIRIYDLDDVYEASVFSHNVDTINRSSQELRVRIVVTNPYFINTNTCELKDKFFIKKIENIIDNKSFIINKNPEYKFNLLIDEKEIPDRSNIKCQNLRVINGRGNVSDWDSNVSGGTNH